MYLSINTREERAEKKEGGLEGPKEKKTEKEKQGRFTEKKNRGGIVLRFEGHDQNRRGNEGKKEK